MHRLPINVYFIVIWNPRMECGFRGWNIYHSTIISPLFSSRSVAWCRREIIMTHQTLRMLFVGHFSRTQIHFYHHFSVFFFFFCHSHLSSMFCLLSLCELKTKYCICFDICTRNTHSVFSLVLVCSADIVYCFHIVGVYLIFIAHNFRETSYRLRDVHMREKSSLSFWQLCHIAHNGPHRPMDNII